jgi:hypothetical protein
MKGGGGAGRKCKEKGGKTEDEVEIEFKRLNGIWPYINVYYNIMPMTMSEEDE